MPHIGEVRLAEEVGLTGKYRVIYGSCPKCKIERFVSIKTPNRLCLSCSLTRATPVISGETRQCIDCDAVFPLTSDYWDSVNGSKGQVYPRRTCKYCESLKRKQKRKNNPRSDKQKQATAKYRKEKIAENRQWYQNLKETMPCTDCRLKFPYYVMDFDHLGPKTYNIARLIGTFTSMCRISHELKKCELVCANCHRIRTHKRKNNLWSAPQNPEPEFSHLPNCKCQQYFTGTSKTPEKLYKEKNFIANKKKDTILNEKFIA